MSVEQVLRTIWRGRWIVLLTVVATTIATYVGSRSAPKVYEATSTLFVGSTSTKADDFTAIQSAQSLTKTYAELIQSTNVADRVATALPGPQTGDGLLEQLTFTPVSETQLISVTANSGSPAGAATLANVYGETFIAYATSNLTSETNSEISLVDRAQPSDSPVRPRPVLYTMLALVLSLFLGALLALLRDQLDGRLGDEQEIARATDAPALASVPFLPKRRLVGGQEQGFLEAFRLLRANLMFLRPGDRVRRLLVTSAEQGEGKTTTTVALARVMAEQGDRVVIVEADMRRPGLSESFEITDDTTGLAQWLVLDVPFDKIVHETSLENVYLVPAGMVTPNPSSLLATDALRRLVDIAGEWADFVIVDSPPLSAGADASILANSVVDVLVVVNQRTSRRQRVQAAIKQLRQAGATVTGIVVNGAEGASTVSYYDYDRQRQRQPRDDSLAHELTTASPRE